MAPHHHQHQQQQQDRFILDRPLKYAPITSLKTLEHGETHTGHNFWHQLVMSLRRRRAWNDMEPVPAHDPLSQMDGVSEKSTKQWKMPKLWAFVAVPIAFLCFFGIVHLVNVWRNLVPVLWDDDSGPFLASLGEPGQPGEGLGTYPPDFSRDITPMPCHSHNDYWRRVPLFDALHSGCTGVEADIWLFDDDLFVGHSTHSLTRNRTFLNLYAKALVEILDRQNPGAEFGNVTRNGVFDEDPSQTLVLLVDIKTSGPEALVVLENQLADLREHNYLTYFDGKSTIFGPVTVVATGNAPFDLLTANTTYRDVFFDAPLADMFEEPINETSSSYERIPNMELPSKPNKIRSQSHALRGTSNQGTVGTTADSTFDLTNSYYASVSFKKSIGYVWDGRLSARQLHLIRGQIQGAKRRGLKVRYWNTPKWPVGLRNHVWDVLVREGVDYLNGDDLKAMTRLDWSQRRHFGWF